MKNWITTFSKSILCTSFFFSTPFSFWHSFLVYVFKVTCCCPFAQPLNDIHFGIQICSYISDKALTKDVSSKLIKAPLKFSQQERGQQNLKQQKNSICNWTTSKRVRI